MAQQPLPHARNAMFAGLLPDELRWLESSVQTVALVAQGTLSESGRPIEHAYFPLSGSVSLFIDLSEGFSVETAQIGNEGMVGIPLVLGHSGSIATAIVQVPGVALRIAADVLVSQLVHLPTLYQNLLRYAGVQAAQSMQLASCNAHHKLDARLARCLLGLHDRSQGDDLALTHENLANLLCAHRPSVSISMKRLERLGLLRQSPRSLTVTDRQRLEQASCECYAIMRDLPAMDGYRSQSEMRSDI